MALKYEGIAAVGDTIRSYDFEGRPDCYYEGPVTSVVPESVCGYRAYAISPTLQVWCGESRIPNRDLIRVPMEMLLADWDGRVVRIGGRA
jgi:hypothetical protein